MLTLSTFWQSLLDVPTIVFVVGGLIAVVAIIATLTSHTLVARARERSRREIAAYVAEGSIDPDKAIEMLKAGESDD